MAKFITADSHFGDERMKILGRPFKFKGEMNAVIVDLYNSVVGQDDEVFIVGDICYKNKDFLGVVDDLKGRKTLIRGNHDSIFTDEDLYGVFYRIVEDGGGIDIDIEGIPCYITHYPTTGKVDRFNLVGHVHAVWKYQLNMFNIGIDANSFLPVNLNTIPFHFDAITKFYDDDVWAAYSDINESYIGKRGKSGTYFKEQKNG